MPAPEHVGLPPALRADHPLRGLGYSQPVRRRTFLRLDGTRAEPGEAPVAEEVPVALVYNMRPYAVMMATPADLEDFAVGFSITEAIVAAAADIDRLAVSRHAQGIEVQVAIPDAAAARLEERGRALIGRAGCGLCGVETIQEAMREPDPLPPGPPISADALWRAERELVPRQVWNAQTGSLHAAGWFDPDGAPGVVREDVGRHNALDKVIGALARGGRDPAAGFVVVTSRASYELVQKAATAGVRLLAAVSRPTGLAIRLAEASGLTLVALLRAGTANVYTHPERLGWT
ncbi:MAG TPA: formate dehydrogenase accessory sulfurtransferase FdhD [Longimicrobiales bacterium]